MLPLARSVAAVRQVEKSLPGLVVEAVEPEDLVNASEIAERLGKSREYVRLLSQGKRGAGDFPAPVAWVGGKHALWCWSEVAKKFHAEAAAGADFLRAFNAALELRNSTAALRAPSERRAIRELADEALKLAS